MSPQRCPGCRRMVKTVEAAADHEDHVREWQAERSREMYPRDPEPRDL